MEKENSMKALLMLLLTLTLNAKICYSATQEPMYITTTEKGLMVKYNNLIYELNYIETITRPDKVVVKRYRNTLGSAEIAIYDNYTKGLYLFTMPNSVLLRKPFINCE
jgi:hypothetical protein